jgi:hypothetical protein
MLALALLAPSTLSHRSLDPDYPNPELIMASSILCLIALMLQVIIETWCKCKNKEAEASVKEEGAAGEKEEKETLEVPEIGPQ